MMDHQDAGTMSDSAVGVSASGQPTSASARAKQQEEKRKKSLMTRLIPGRQNQQNTAGNGWYIQLKLTRLMRGMRQTDNNFSLLMTKETFDKSFTCRNGSVVMNKLKLLSISIIFYHSSMFPTRQEHSSKIIKGED